ncbi:arylsulfatase [Aquimarina sediminis]|uniref:arylsulfatase n=1 Tax=Aquimarina sediminis TaxID=2070536 RepID=UPI000CA03E91|nr:arylsulfatase [Aquimarina sediminis]
MKNVSILIFCLGIIGCNTPKDNEVVSPPNVIYFLADDLGYGELGVYGQKKIKTPHIDALANNGMLFTQHYSGAPVCAPSRNVFLTGKHTGHAFIRGNDEWAERGDVWDYQKAFLDPRLEGQFPIPPNTLTLGRLLKKSGYKTSVFGKWGLGAPESQGIPNLQGFDYFYGYNCQRQAHNLYPSHLWENRNKILLKNEMIPPNTKLDSLSDPNKESSYQKYNQKEYAPEVIHQKALSFIKENKEQPFFMYYATPLPHLPLQAPKKYVDEYKNTFGEEEPYIGNKGYFPARYPKATYAAMITYMDKQLGELVALLKEEGIYENTIIIFSSDNGPTYTGGVDFDFFESSKPFTNGYGRTKGFVYEGGIRVPLIVSWPNHIKKGSKNDHVSAFYDMMPTICDIAGVKPPEGIDGISFKPTLFNQKQKDHEFLYWEFPGYNGQQAVRMGKWKGVRKNIFDGNFDVELYNLETDIKEMNDVSKSHPAILKKIKQIMIDEHEPSLNENFKFKELGDL